MKIQDHEYYEAIVTAINGNLEGVITYPAYQSTVDEWVKKTQELLPDDISYSAISYIILKICSQTLGMFNGGDILHGIEYTDGKFIVDCSDEYYEHFSVEVEL